MKKVFPDENFVFTQQSLKTFNDCPLKFKKKYGENIRWNGPYDEKMRERIEKGSDFHLLAYRYFSGINTGLEYMTGNTGELKKWLINLARSFPHRSGVSYLPEYKARIVSGDLRLEANFDLVVIKGDSIEIWDWKTHGVNSGKDRVKITGDLEESMQTLVYLFVIKEHSAMLTGKRSGNIEISMHYWQPEAPHVLAEIEYNDEKHEKFRRNLEDNIKNIRNYDYGSFDREAYRKHCRTCEFNMFCNNEKTDFTEVDD